MILAVFALGKSINNGKIVFCSAMSSSIKPFSLKIRARLFVAASLALIASSVRSSALF